MGLTEFYDNVVLRDLLEYAAPGAIVVTAVGLVLEAFNTKLGLGMSVTSFALTHPWPALVLIIFPSYVIGHVLTAIYDWLGRGREKEVAAQTLTKNDWLRLRTVKVVARDLRITEEECLAFLTDPVQAEMLREIGRSVIHRRALDLYREFVGRHSVLSRFCQNMVLAIIVFGVLISLSVWIVWDELPAKAHIATTQWPFKLTALTFIIFGLLSMFGLSRRALRLRRTMTKHTFQIWCLVSGEDELTNVARGDEKEIAPIKVSGDL